MNKSWKTLNGDNFKWGGENAGALLTKFLQPEKFIIYTKDKNELMKSLKLVPDPLGEIEVLDQFWFDKESDENIVPSLLAYADLINLDTLFGLCAPATYRNSIRGGFRVISEIGINGKFYYPKEDLTATSILVDDIKNLPFLWAVYLS